MKNPEIKNLETKLKLYEEVQNADNMILNHIQNACGLVLSQIIKPKMFFKEGQETVKLTADEFTQIRVLLARISLNDYMKEIGSGMVKEYLNEKREKLRIIGMLS